MNNKAININCQKVFFDFDGVIVDSNKFKENAIKESIEELNLSKDKIDAAISYFNAHAGVGRKRKLLKFFNKNDTEKILEIYSKKCINYFSKASPTLGFEDFIKELKKFYPSIKLYILSGGNLEEINCFLKANQMENLFFKILFDNLSKSQHLINEEADKNDIFFGDSKGDLKTARKHSLCFILVKGFCSSESKPEYIDEQYAKISIENFSNILINK
tara:strand:- start:5247 stop:5897 length:651 start_codon:yes stop_codon:yes gene_type:complete